MFSRQRKPEVLLLVVLLIVPRALSQKGSPTPPPTTTPRGPTTTPPPSSQIPPLGGTTDLVMFINGKVAMDDGSSLPSNILIDRICSGQTRQQVHADLKGNFTFQLGSRFTEVTSDVSVSPQFGSVIGGSQTNNYGSSTQMGVSRQVLWSCEISAQTNGIRSAAVNLSAYAPGETIDVGTIFLQRGEKAEGTTISATSYQAPKDAKKAYEKGLEAARKDKFDDAQKLLEKAVQIYPQYAMAWQRLGNVYDHQNQPESAKKAYEQAITADPRFVPPYLSMALIAANAGNWKDVLTMTQRGIDLDPLSFPVAYYFNSLANYRLNNLQAAEKGARSAEHYDQQNRMPQVHLLLGTILTDNKAYSEAITEYSAFLKLVPDSKDAAAVRAKVTNLEKLAAKNSSDQ